MSNVLRAARGEPAHQHFSLQSVAGQERVPIARIQISASQNMSLLDLLNQAQMEKVVKDAARPPLVAENTSKMIASTVLTVGQMQVLKNFAAGQHTAVIIDGLPIGQIGQTPVDGLRPSDKDLVSEMVLLGLAAVLGYPMGYKNEKLGEIIQQVVPIDSKQDVKNSNASRQSFEFHVDNIFLRPQYRQEVIGLFCLRNPSEAATLLIDLHDLVARMPKDMLEMAMGPNTRFGVSKSFDMGGGVYFTDRRPLLYHGNDGLLRINANTYNMFLDNPGSSTMLGTEESEMLREFVKLVESTKRHRVVLSPGQLLFFRDDMAMHGREGFEGDRWLQRTYVRFSLEELWQVTGDRSARVFEAKEVFLR